MSLRDPFQHPIACSCRECKARHAARSKARVVEQLSIETANRVQDAPENSRRLARKLATARGLEVEIAATDRLVDDLHMARVRAAADRDAARYLELRKEGFTIAGAIAQIDEEK